MSNGVVFLDTETTGLHERRMPWEIGLITRTPGTDPDGGLTDVEHHWFVHPADLRWYERDRVALDIGRFWDRHPHAAYLSDGGDPLTAPDRPDVVRLHEALALLAQHVADRQRVAGSHPAFDMQVLGREMAAVGITPGWHYHPDDVPSLIRGWLRGKGRPLPDQCRSDDLCRAIGLEPDWYDRHTALGDCRLFRDAYDLVEGAGPPSTVADDDPEARFVLRAKGDIDRFTRRVWHTSQHNKCVIWLSGRLQEDANQLRVAAGLAEFGWNDAVDDEEVGRCSVHPDDCVGQHTHNPPVPGRARSKM